MDNVPNLPLHNETLEANPKRILYYKAGYRLLDLTTGEDALLPTFPDYEYPIFSIFLTLHGVGIIYDALKGFPYEGSDYVFHGEWRDGQLIEEKGFTKYIHSPDWIYAVSIIDGTVRLPRTQSPASFKLLPLPRLKRLR